MCGICGLVRFDRNVSDDDQVIVGKMNRKLKHRGPDAQDTFLFDNVALGFSRLSIIGLSNGMQPIENEDGSLVLVCNGEIFNYIELRESLQKMGHVFKTASDVEVILHLYEEYSTDFLNKLNGQFAFALYDKKRRRVLCARDQMGIIPFYYTFVNNAFIFGSEIKAILEHPDVEREVDLVGLDQIFTFAGLISPRTMFRNINSLENGHFLTVNATGSVTKHEYWDLYYPQGKVIMNGKPESYYVDALEEIFENSIRLRLRSDVPCGFYLSGGLDSSMIAMKAHQMAPSVLKDAFSIDFIDSEHSESSAQKLIARACGANLHQKTFFYDDISERLRQSVYHSECPIKETYNTASLSLSESVRAKGIKVILSGEGADEFFAGYVGYRFDKMRSLQMIDIPGNDRERSLRSKLWGDSDFYYERNFSDHDVLKKSLYHDAVTGVFNKINCLNHPVIDPSKINKRSLLNKRAYIDYKIRLVDHLVADHGDRMALANGVEVRYPFLDKDLIQFSATLPDELKLNEFTEKYILKKMASRFTPKAITEKEKFHFIAPGSPHLLRKKVPYISDLLSYDRIKRQGYFNPDTVERLKRTYSQEGFTINAPFESDLLIIVITFGMLLDEFFE